MNSDFLWGGATAAYQAEGAWDKDGKVESIWDYYMHKENLPAADVHPNHYDKYKEDIRLAKEGGHTSYRFSLSWPRIIKNKDGDVNEKGLEFYSNLIDECLAQNIEPFVTLYHWDIPMYLQEEGGWINLETAYAFENLAKVCFDKFGDRVKYWTTLNEPKWTLSCGYMIGNHPPFKQDPQEYIYAAFSIMYASSLAIKVFKEGNYEGKIGIVHSYTPVFGVDETIETKIAVRNADNYNNNWVLDTAVFGEFPTDLLDKLQGAYDLSMMTPERLKTIKEHTVDYIGLNYYSGMDVKEYSGGETTLYINNKGKGGGKGVTIIKNWFEQVFREDAQHTDWGMEIDPEGLYKGLLMAYEKYKLPIFVTENGIGMYEDPTVDFVEDDDRIKFLNDHIYAIIKAKNEGVDVRGYFIWSLFDLYSWISGLEKRYGLISVENEKNDKRKPKKSFYWLKDIINGTKNIKPY